MTHPKVKHACIVGLPDALKGEIVVAALELHAGASATIKLIQQIGEGVTAFLQKRQPRYL